MNLKINCINSSKNNSVNFKSKNNIITNIKTFDSPQIKDIIPTRIIDKCVLSKALIEEEIASGKTYKQMARKYNCSIDTIMNWVKEKRLNYLYEKINGISNFEKDEFKSYVLQGKNIVELSKIYNCTAERIDGVLKEYKLLNLYKTIQKQFADLFIVKTINKDCEPINSSILSSNKISNSSTDVANSTIQKRESDINKEIFNIFSDNFKTTSKISSNEVEPLINLLADKLDMTKPSHIVFLENKPRLVLTTPENSNNNPTQEQSASINKKVQNHIQLALNNTKSAYLSTKMLNRNLKSNAKVLGLKEDDFLQFAIKNPYLLLMSSDTLNIKIRTYANIKKLTIEDTCKLIIEKPYLLLINQEDLCYLRYLNAKEKSLKIDKNRVW